MFKGGTLAATGSGKWVITDPNDVLDGSTASGAVTIATTLTANGGDTLTLKGTIHNEGKIALTGGTALAIAPAAGVTLDSGGKTTKGVVTLDDNPGNAIEGLGGLAATLTNVDNTISGTGQFADLTIVNEAGGIIDATGAKNQLIVDSSDTLKNSGLVEAIGAAGLSLSGQTIDATTGGVVTVGAGSLIDIFNDTFKGGTLAATGSGKWVITDPNDVLDGSTASGAVTNATTLTANAGDALTLKGTIHNEGKIALTGGTALAIDPTAGVTLDSGGKTTKGVMTLDDNSGNAIEGLGGAAATLTNVDNKISGSGQFADLTIVNEAGGVIDATGANNQLVIDSPDSLKNSGIVEATGAAGLALSSATIANAGGTIAAGNGSQVVLTSDLLNNGTLQTTGSGVIEIADSGTNLSAGTMNLGLTLDAKIQVDNGMMLALTGSVVNNGSFLVGAASAATLELGATLNGTGTIVLSDSATTQVVGGFNNVANTISGAGVISAKIQQQSGGVIEATRSDNALILNTGTTIENGGALEAVGGSLIVDDAVSGSGRAIVASGGSLIFHGAFDENIAFSGAEAGSVALSDPYGGAISGFGAGDSIELLGVSADSASLNTSDNELIVSSDGKEVAKLHLVGNYPGVAFDTKTDAAGTTIVEIAAPTVAQYLASPSTYDAMPGGFFIIDTATNIESAILILAADPHLKRIESTAGLVTVSAAKFVAAKVGLDKVAGGFIVADTAAVIEAKLAALARRRQHQVDRRHRRDRQGLRGGVRRQSRRAR